jgi:hypothetical protein
MAAVQKNFQNFTYTDDNGVTWTKRGETGDGRQAVDGNAAVAGHPTWTDSPRMKTRSIIYTDATTFRTKRVIFYTAAAFAAVALGDIIAFMVEGESVAVNYAATKKQGERQPSRSAARQLADHA